MVRSGSHGNKPNETDPNKRYPLIKEEISKKEAKLIKHFNGEVVPWLQRTGGRGFLGSLHPGLNVVIDDTPNRRMIPRDHFAATSLPTAQTPHNNSATIFTKCG